MMSYARPAPLHSSLEVFPIRQHVRTVGVLVVVGLFALGPAFGPPSFGQAHDARADAEAVGTGLTTTPWSGHFDEEAAHLLRTRPDARTPVLNDIIRVVNEDGPRTNLSATVWPLVEVASSDPKLERRLKAVEALQHIGPDGVIASVYRTTVRQVADLFGVDAKKCGGGRHQA